MAKQKERKAYTREERKMQVLGALAIARFEGADGLTARGIAEALKMTTSTHLRKLLAEMEEAKDIIFFREDDPGIAGFRIVYMLPEDVGTRDIMKRAQGYVYGRKVETAKQREERLIRAINREQGQTEMSLS